MSHTTRLRAPAPGTAAAAAAANVTAVTASKKTWAATSRRLSTAHTPHACLLFRLG
jgi:hypothetical protein